VIKLIKINISIILDDFLSSIKGFSKAYQIECVGGGRIFHTPEKKEIFVYGYSQVLST
jgi:hypothetical protein